MGLVIGVDLLYYSNRRYHILSGTLHSEVALRGSSTAVNASQVFDPGGVRSALLWPVAASANIRARIYTRCAETQVEST